MFIWDVMLLYRDSISVFWILNVIMGVILLFFVSIVFCCMGLEIDFIVELNYK